MSEDIKNIRDACGHCCRNAPSQAATPEIQPQTPATPFECIAADFFETHGHQFLVVADRLSGWVELFSSPSGSFKSTADGLIAHLRNLFKTFGVPVELSSDGGPQFKSSVTEAFLARWGVQHRMSSAYFPQSNGRAEVAVKTAKRLLMNNIGPSGSLNSDRFLRAILQLCNTPDPDCNISPAEIIFCRPLRDAFSFVSRMEKYKNPEIRPMWRDTWKAKEEALRTRFTRTMERLNSHARTLPPLRIGEQVFVQNQAGNHPTKWDKSGVVVEATGNDQYLVKIDGSGRVTLRNRRFLRSYTPASPTISMPMPSFPADKDPVVYKSPPLEDEKETASNLTPVPQDMRAMLQVPSTPRQREVLSDVESQPQRDLSTPITDEQDQAPAPQLTQRPRRDRKQRKFYQADTGTWEAP